MTRHILNKGSTHSVIKLMMYLVTLVKGNPLPNYSWWKYTVLVFMVLFHGTWTILQLMLSVPHGERVWGVPYCTHSSLLPVMSSYLPLLDEMCCTTALFIKSCLESDSSILFLLLPVMVFTMVVWTVCHLGRNAFFCCSRYDVICH